MEPSFRAWTELEDHGLVPDRLAGRLVKSIADERPHNKDHKGDEIAGDQAE
jgi:hypothetical protein